MPPHAGCRAQSPSPGSVQNRPDTRIMLASGFADDALRGQDKHLAAIKILRKPYGRGELARSLRQLLDGG